MKRYKIDYFDYSHWVRNGRNYLKKLKDGTFALMKPLKPLPRREYYIYDGKGFYAGGFRTWWQARQYINKLTKR